MSVIRRWSRNAGDCSTEAGVIHQRPYLESTPRYKPGARFAELGLDEATIDVFSAVAKAQGDLGLLIHDPPYQHQATRRTFACRRRSLVVTTGTGSGKTECFLLPILGKLASEARAKAGAFGATPAVRAMVLYPMNALVNDQLGRLRLLFGDPRILDEFIDWSGRPARSRATRAGPCIPACATKERSGPAAARSGSTTSRIWKLPERPVTGAGERRATRAELKKRGKWPAKPDLIGVVRQEGNALAGRE